MTKNVYRIFAIFLTAVMLFVFTACSQKDAESSKPTDTENKTSTITSAQDASEAETEALKALAIKYADKTIGVQIGTVFDAIINQYIPKAKIEYYNSNADMALALKSGKISAYIADEPMARLLCQTYTDQYITGVFEKCPYAYIYPKDTHKTKIIVAQMNEYLSKIKNDGTLKEIDNIWFGDDESLRVVDTSHLTGENGTLEFSIATAVGAPFVYIKDNNYVGYDVDIAVRFCKAYGYKINITDYNVGGFFASISSGVADFGASSICVTEERKEVMDFSDSNYEGSVVLVTRKLSETDVSEIVDVSQFEELKGKNIGTIRNTVSVDYVEDNLPTSKLFEMNTVDELVKALDNGEIDAYVADQPIARQALSAYTDHHVLGVAEKADYGFVFKKNYQNSDILRAQMNAFLQTIKANGTLDEIDSIWFGDDEEKQFIDYSDLTGKNGIIKVAMCSSVSDPFFYYKDGIVCGYEADIVHRFCKEYGYKVEYCDTDIDFNEIFNLIETGVCDMGASCITITEARQQIYNFSDPDYNGGTVFVVKIKNEFDVSETSSSEVLAELDGKKIGYLDGTVYADIIKNSSIKSPVLIPYSNIADTNIALESGDIDAFIIDQPVARMQAKSYQNHKVHSVLGRERYAFAFQKDNQDYPQLREQMNYFLKDIKADGILDKLDEIWFGDNVSIQTIDWSQLTGENGTLRLAVVLEASAPFCYVKDDQYLGYEIDIAVRFCQKYGYGLEIINYQLIQDALDAIAKGDCEFGCSVFSVTEERKQFVDFSDPHYYGGYLIIVKESEEKAESRLATFINSTINSFRKTFIREDRWKMFASGLGITVFITLLSAILGSALGFGMFLLYRKKYKLVQSLMDKISAFLQMTPIVVIVMICYYLVFGKAGLSGIKVSIIAFSMMFACIVLDLFKSSVKAVDEGQMLAVRALGYRDTKGFLRMILPQAIPHFMSGYKGALVSLIKSTSIVSYVAVQDLTMVTDIIRSRTYEAFFPLVVTAAIYFTIALLLTKIVGCIELGLKPENRKESKIMKGVNKK